MPEWHEFYCGTCHTEAAFYGEPPDEYEFRCECPEQEPDPLGFCSTCFRVRWLARVTSTIKGTPHGVCRTCEREERDAP